jgi:hypothetical protein
MPKKLRDKARLAVLQGWFDESGKEGWPRKGTSPVFLLAGYVAPVRIWAKFADAWQTELDRHPKLDSLHTKDAYGFAEQFGRDSLWERTWGFQNEVERNKRLLAFAEIIREHLQPMWTAYNTPDRLGLTWMVSHNEYAAFRKAMENHPKANPRELEMIKHPYYLSLQYVLGSCLKYKNAARSPDEPIQILFDCGMDKHSRLKIAFEQWVEVVRMDAPHLLKQLVNKEAEFRDDEKHPELQAADLLAYHLRKYVYEITQMKNWDYQYDRVWTTVHSKKLEFLDLRYEAKQWLQLAGKIQQPFWPFWGTIKPKAKL